MDDSEATSYDETTVAVQNVAPSDVQLDPLEAHVEGSDVTVTGRFDEEPVFTANRQPP